GSTIAYISVIISKILGALYVIPFYAIIGEEAGYIYSAAYTVYNLVLNASTSGIPTAMSILVADYNTRNLQRTKRKIYNVGLLTVGGISILLFLMLQIFAGQLAGFYMGQMQESAVVNTGSIAMAIRAMSLCLLFAPFLSVKRGFLQGHNYIAHSSYSQVVEQVVRIAVVLAGSYLTVKLLGLGGGAGVNVALAGAAVGAAAALIYLNVKTAGHDADVLRAVQREQVPSVKSLILQILKYSIPVVIVATSTNLYEIVDMKLMLVGLGHLGFADSEIQLIASTLTTWTPKICMLISALSMGMTASLVPSITGSFVQKKYGEVNRKLVLAINTIIVVAAPLAIGLSLLSGPAYALFYSPSEYGAVSLAVMSFLSVLSSVKIIVCMSLQSLGRARLVCGCTLLGLAINAVLDLPMILLFNLIGLPAYLGATFSSAVGVIATITIALVSLKKRMKFRYVIIVRTLIKIILPCAALIAAVLVMKLFIPIPESRGILLVLTLGLFALVGGAAYGFTAYKLHLIQDIFGENFLGTILRKLHIKK
ncbi:MAG: oligosaccharide flippase family protein, partial [Acutalibacteraceae bacterium]